MLLASFQAKGGVGVVLKSDLVHRFPAARTLVKAVGEIAHQARVVAEIPVAVHHPRGDDNDSRTIFSQDEYLAHAQSRALSGRWSQRVTRNSPGPGKQKRSVCRRWAWGPRPNPGCVTEI